MLLCKHRCCRHPRPALTHCTLRRPLLLEHACAVANVDANRRVCAGQPGLTEAEVAALYSALCALPALLAEMDGHTPQGFIVCKDAVTEHVATDAATTGAATGVIPSIVPVCCAQLWHALPVACGDPKLTRCCHRTRASRSTSLPSCSHSTARRTWMPPTSSKSPPSTGRWTSTLPTWPG